MCHALNTYEGNDTVSLCLRRMLQGDLPTYSVAPHSLNVEGRAEVIIVGQGHAHLRNFPLLTGAKATLSVTPEGATLYYAR